MDELENNLRAAFREVEPRADLTAKVMARVAAARRAASPARWMIAVAAVTAWVVVSVAVFEKVTNGPPKSASGSIHRIDASAAVESADGGLFRNEGAAIPAGAKIAAGEAVRTHSAIGSVLSLADGSKIEIRAESSLSLEPAEDGIRIRLDHGGIIVTAARQRTGHLYVQTKDVAVSVVGTVFLVNAEEAGSRVAVIQGEVQVRQGAESEKLRPGDQVATNPLMESHPLIEQISWSRSAPAYIALLEQSARQTFGAVSIKPVSQSPEFGSVSRLFKCRGVDGVFYASTGSLMQRAAVAGELASSAALAPQGRCVGLVHPRMLIAMAYDTLPARISNALSWPDIYMVEAVAENPGTATKQQLRQMLQTVLAERYGFKFHRETHEGPGVILRVGKNGPKFKETSDEEEIQPTDLRTLASGEFKFKGKIPIRTFAEGLFLLNSSVPVLDKTGLSGIYDISVALEFAGNSPGGGDRGGGAGEFSVSRVSKQLEDQLGLTLEAAKVPVDYIFVDQIRAPTEN
jgi:uncharacterized protein (TIGR03435 family)